MIGGFTVRNWKKLLVRFPTEDSYSIDKLNEVFAVADGVTRDCTNGQIAGRSFSGFVHTFCYYPRPSPAKLAADLFCLYVPRFLRDFSLKDENSIRKSIAHFNEGLKRVNDSLELSSAEVNYLEKDFAGCVASVSALQFLGTQRVVNYGFICDCGVAFFNSNGELLFKTPDECPHRLEQRISEDEEVRGKSWKDSEMRVRTRSYYRNNPSNPNSYGVLTGEETAMHYVKTGVREVSPGDFCLTYSDGVEPIIFSDDFPLLLRKGDLREIKKHCQKKVKSEGTLIISKID